MTERPRLTPAIADVRRAVRENWDACGVASGDLVMVACSGGADSLALAAAAKFEGNRAGISIGAVVVEHGLQEATKAVATEVVSRLTSLGLAPVLLRPVEVSVDAGAGVEAAARDARYAALESAAVETGAKFVLLGHTLDDQAETVLLGLARGSGPRSIAGMAPANGLWLRPLLGIRRSTTEAFCADSGLDAWQDPHNFDEKYSRVRVRRKVLPNLEAEIGPGVAEALARTAEIMREDASVLDEVAAAEFKRLAKVAATEIELAAEKLAALPAGIRNRVILRTLETFGASVSRTHVLAVAELVLNWHGQKELTLPGVRVIRKADVVTFKIAKTLQPGAC